MLFASEKLQARVAIPRGFLASRESMQVRSIQFFGMAQCPAHCRQAVGNRNPSPKMNSQISESAF